MMIWVLVVFLALLSSPAVATVTRDADGWTVITPSGDSRLIYVSSTGSSANDGLTSSTPKQTIAQGEALLRNGFPDWLQLKCGDTFTAGINVPKSGRSADEPMVYTHYSSGPCTQRPIIDSTTTGGIVVIGSGERNYISVIGIELYYSERDPSSPNYNPAVTDRGGIGWNLEGHDILIEDVYSHYWDAGMNFLTPAGTARRSSLTIRRCVIQNSYPRGGNIKSGMFIQGTDNLTIEENAFLHNGWLEETGRDGAPEDGGATIFDHNVYLQSGLPSENKRNSNVIFRKNITWNGAATGVQHRPGGVNTNNLYIDEPTAIWLSVKTPDGANEVSYNVIDGASDITSSDLRGICINVGDNLTYPDYIFNNLCINNDTSAGADDFGIVVTTDPSTEARDFQFTNNRFYNWNRGYVFTDSRTINPIITGNVFWGGTPPAGNFQGTTYNWYDPTRSVATYAAHIGLTGTTQAFVNAVAANWKGNWDARLTADAANSWIRDGFFPVGIRGATIQGGSIH